MTKKIEVKTGVDVLYEKVLAWGKKRKIDNPVTQLNKILEELGEALEAENDDALKDAIGDITVATILLANMVGVDFRKTVKNFMRVLPKDDDGAVILNTMNLVIELGHIADIMNHKKSKYDIESSLTLTMTRIELLSASVGFQLYDCVERAYNDIKDRKGMTINGNFMKEQ